MFRVFLIASLVIFLSPRHGQSKEKTIIKCDEVFVKKHTQGIPVHSKSLSQRDSVTVLEVIEVALVPRGKEWVEFLSNGNLIKKNRKSGEISFSGFGTSSSGVGRGDF